MSSNSNKRPEVLILLGLSGAGRSASCNVFEDRGYYVIENLPPDLIESVVKSNDVAESNKQLVLTVDARDGVAQSDPLYIRIWRSVASLLRSISIEQATLGHSAESESSFQESLAIRDRLYYISPRDISVDKSPWNDLPIHLIRGKSCETK